MRFGYDGGGRRLWKREYLPRPLGVVVRLTLYAGYGFEEGYVEEVQPHEAGAGEPPSDVCGKVEGVTDLGFTGQRQEIGFGLYDYNARYFSPALGRFISPDPIVPDYSNPQALNRYAYVYNNPLNYIDPTGHMGCGVAVVCDELFTGLGSTSNGGRGGQVIALVALTGIAGLTAYIADGLGGTVEVYPLDPPPDPSEYRDISLIAPPHIMQPHSAPMNTDFPELHADPLPLDSGLTIEDTYLTARVYEPSPKHHPNARSGINAAPTNGQTILDNSIQIKQTSTRRIGVDASTGEFVIFDQTIGDIYHGHVRTWKELTQEMKNALIKEDLVTKKGKIK